MVRSAKLRLTSRRYLFSWPVIRSAGLALYRSRNPCAPAHALSSVVDREVVMPKTAFQLNLKKPPEDAAVKTHNRWHPDIPMVETFKPGAEFRVECFDWTGGQIFNDDSANDVRDVDLTKVHYLSGPFGVEGAEP